MAKRIQRKRTKGWRMPENAVYVGRPGRFGNPFYAGMWKGYGLDDVLRDYRAWLNREGSLRSCDLVFGEPPSLVVIREQLGGKDLVCWCAEGSPCHADILLELANEDLVNNPPFACDPED